MRGKFRNTREARLTLILIEILTDKLQLNGARQQADRGHSKHSEYDNHSPTVVIERKRSVCAPRAAQVFEPHRAAHGATLEGECAGTMRTSVGFGVIIFRSVWATCSTRPGVAEELC
jgi:hypothetical protein